MEKKKCTRGLTLGASREASEVEAHSVAEVRVGEAEETKGAEEAEEEVVIRGCR